MLEYLSTMILTGWQSGIAARNVGTVSGPHGEFIELMTDVSQTVAPIADQTETGPPLERNQARYGLFAGAST